MTHGRSIAAAQTIPIRGDVDANLEEHVRLAHFAAGQQARLLVFPELSLTGYELDLADELAFSERDPRLAPLVELAAACSMTLVVGAPVRLGPNLHLGAFILSPDRSVDVYTKHHLGAFPSSASPDGSVPPPEASVFQPGNRSPLVRLGDGVAAVAVCVDIGRPSHPESAAKRGARTYLASTFVIPSDFESDTAKLRSYAVRHSMAVLLANYGGPSGGLPSAGGSAIWSDRGELLAQLGTNGSGVVIASEGPSGWRAGTVGGAC
jgi:predicted amidohydrolase